MKKVFILVLLIMSVFFFSLEVWAQAQKGLEVGSYAPNFEALTHKEEVITLSDIYKKGPVVLIFYRGGWCPYCNRQLQDFQSHLSEFQSMGASIIAISIDTQQNVAKTAEDNRLGFDIITDPEAYLLELYNVIYQIPEDLARTYKEQYNIDLEAFSGRKDHIIAIPAVYVVNKKGKIIFAYANEDYKVRKSAEEILSFLKANSNL